MLFFNYRIMLIVNKSEKIQRTEVYGVRQDLKPWEIVDVSGNEAKFLFSVYGEIFWEVKEPAPELVKEEVLKPKKK